MRHDTSRETTAPRAGRSPARGAWRGKEEATLPVAASRAARRNGREGPGAALAFASGCLTTTLGA
jgi:hypothetical protein